MSTVEGERPARSLPETRQRGSAHPDSIERQLDIDAGIERVFRLVSRPGWWINDGAIIDHRIETEGDVSIVHDPKHGAFRIRTVRQDPPHYVSFRWLGGDPASERLENGQARWSSSSSRSAPAAA